MRAATIADVRRVLPAVGLVLALALPFGAAGASAAEPLDARVLVVDAAGMPAPGVDVFAREKGTLVSLGRTDASGVLTVHVASGESLVARIGSRTSAPVALTARQARIVLPVAKIGTVRAHNDRDGEPTVTSESPSAIVFDDLALARTLVPNYRSRAEGGSGHQMLNGVPLDLPSGPRTDASDEPGVPSDLIESFSATQADDGTVTPNYHLLAPTPHLAMRFGSGLSAFDGSLWKAGVSGTVHGLGFAVAAATGGDDGPLAGATLVDASGAGYDHSTHARHTDVSFSFSHGVGSTQINAAGFSSRQRGDDIALSLPGTLLDGIGPGNVTTKTSSFEYVIAMQTHGRDSYHLLDARFAGGSADDAPAALVDGVSAGYTSGYRYFGNYDEFAFTRAFGPASLTLKSTFTQTATTGYVATPSFAAQVPAHNGLATLGLDYERSTGSHGYGFALDDAQRSGSFAGTDLEARAHVKTMLAGTALQLSASRAQTQVQEAYSAGAYEFGAPSAATITCSPPSATVVGPAGALGSHPTADTLDLHLRRRLANEATLSAGGFVSAGRDGLVFPASALGATLDPAYRAQVASDVALLCPGRTLGAADLFVQRYESVPRLSGREWFVDATLPLGALRAEATYETYSLTAPQLPADLAGIPSTLVAGAQVPGVPLHRANLLLSYRRLRFVAAAALQYTSDNNVDALPGHVTVAAGLQLPAGPGVVAFAAQNLFGAYSGTYVSPMFAVPLATSSGVLPTLAIPLRPAWSLRYTLPLGPSSLATRQ